MVDHSSDLALRPHVIAREKDDAPSPELPGVRTDQFRGESVEGLDQLSARGEVTYDFTRCSSL